MTLPFTIFCGFCKKNDENITSKRSEFELPFLKRMIASIPSRLAHFQEDDFPERDLDSDDGCGMYTVYNSYHNTYSKQFPEEGEEDFYNPSKLSFHLTPLTSCNSDFHECVSDKGLFLEDAWAKTGDAPAGIEAARNDDYGFFVDLHDSFDPRLCLRSDADDIAYALPPGEQVSKIIIRTRLMKMKEQHLGSRENSF
jgi:hypothetical protein